MINVTEEDVIWILSHLKKTLKLNIDIKPAVVTEYHLALKRYSLKILSDVIPILCESWDKPHLPPASMISMLCAPYMEPEEAEEVKKTEEKTRYNQEYYDLKSHYKVDCLDLSKRILAGAPLTEKQMEGKVIVDQYMEISFPNKDVKTELEGGKSAFTVAYFGLYRDFLAGTLEPLTGRPQGNLLSKEETPEKRIKSDENYFMDFKLPHTVR